MATKLTIKQDKYVNAVRQGKNHREASEAAGMNQHSITSMKTNKPAFKEAIEEAKKEYQQFLLEQTERQREREERAISTATEHLLQAIESEDTDPLVKLKIVERISKKWIQKQTSNQNVNLNVIDAKQAEKDILDFINGQPDSKKIN